MTYSVLNDDYDPYEDEIFCGDKYAHMGHWWYDKYGEAWCDGYGKYYYNYSEDYEYY